MDPDTLLSWIKEQVREHADLEVTNLTASFRDGRVLCAIISHYRPDLLDYSAINAHDSARNNQVAFDLLEKELGKFPSCSAISSRYNVIMLKGFPRLCPAKRWPTTTPSIFQRC